MAKKEAATKKKPVKTKGGGGPKLVIIDLFVENYGNIRALQVRPKPDRRMVKVSGANAAGKSNTINSFWAAIGGAKARPKVPLRAGARSGKVRAELGMIDSMEVAEFVVEWRFNDRGRDELSIRGQDGKDVPGGPRTFIDRMLQVANGSDPKAARYATDPMTFAAECEHNPKRAMETLLEVLGDQLPKGWSLAAVNAKRDDIFEQRTVVNREVKRLKTLLETMPRKKVERVDVTDLVNRQQEIRQRQTEIQEIINDADRAETAVTTAQDRVTAAKENVTEAEALVEDLKRQLEEAETGLLAKKGIVDTETKQRAFNQKLANTAASKAKAVARESDDLASETEEIDVKLTDAAEMNEAASRWDERVRTHKELRVAEEKAQGMTNEIQAIDDEKAEIFGALEMPVKGMGLDEEVGVTFKSLPVEQASESQKMMIGVGVLAARNPEIRVIRFEHASLLDSKMEKYLESLCFDHDLYVWCEKVDDSEGVQGIKIIDGEIAGDEDGISVPVTPDDEAE